MSRKLCFILIIAVPLELLLGSSIYAAQDPTEPDRNYYSVKPTYHMAQIDRFEVNLTSTMERSGGERFDLSMTVVTTETVQEIKNDGTIVMAVRTDAAHMKVNGENKPVSQVGQTVLLSVNKDGKPIGSEKGAPVEDEGNTFQSYFQQGNLFMMAPPLRIGEKWEYQLPVTKNKAKCVMTLLGLERKGTEFPTDVLKVLLTGDYEGSFRGVQQKMHIDAKSFLEVGTGKPFSTEITLVSTPKNSAQDPTVRLEMTRTLLWEKPNDQKQ